MHGKPLGFLRVCRTGLDSPSSPGWDDRPNSKLPVAVADTLIGSTATMPRIPVKQFSAAQSEFVPRAETAPGRFDRRTSRRDQTGLALTVVRIWG